MEKYDFVIIGAGPAGLSAAVYAARFKLKTIVIGEIIGGTVVNTNKLENWPGAIEINGWDLAENLKKHVQANEVEIINSKVISVEKKDNLFLIKTSSQNYYSKAILFATGTTRRKLGVVGEKEFEHKGVSYCAVCDGGFFKEKTVAVIGGSDSAIKEALYLADHASKVFIIYRKNKLRAEPISLERLENKKNIEIMFNKNIGEIFGDTKVKGVKFKEGGELALDGVFVEVGAEPNSEFASSIGVKINSKKEIIIDKNSKTNVPGVFAAGDVTDNSFKQVIIASAEGVISSFSVYEFINSN